MTEEHRRQRKNLIIGGFACLGALILAFGIFAMLDMPGSPITKAISLPLLIGAVGCFVGAARVKRDAGAAAQNPGQPGQPGHPPQ